MLLRSRWSHRAAAGQLHRMTDKEDTYHPAVKNGMTLHHFQERILLGHGEAAFQTAGALVTSLEMHRRAGLRVASSAPTVSVGGLVVLGFRVGPLQILAPCRISETWDSPTTAGFGYVTLPGHPECGYERFLVERTVKDEVFLEIRSRSRTGSTLLRPLSPLNRAFQRRITRNYQRAVQDAVAHG